MISNVIRLIKEISLLARSFSVSFVFEYLFWCVWVLPKIVQLRSLSPVDAKIARELRLTSHGFFFEFPAHAISLVREILLHNCYGFAGDRKYTVVLDLGANSGVFSALAAKCSERVVSVECNGDALGSVFDAIMALNGASNVEFVAGFISDECRGNNISVNQLVSDFGISAIDFMKVDIEGAETFMFRSNLEWLNICREISMEVHPCFGVDVCEIMGKLSAFGFHTVLLDKAFSPVPFLTSNSIGYLRAVRL